MQTMGLPFSPCATLRNLDYFQLGFHETLIQKSALKVGNLEKKSKKFLTVFLRLYFRARKPISLEILRNEMVLSICPFGTQVIFIFCTTRTMVRQVVQKMKITQVSKSQRDRTTSFSKISRLIDLRGLKYNLQKTVRNFLDFFSKFSTFRADF